METGLFLLSPSSYSSVVWAHVDHDISLGPPSRFLGGSLDGCAAAQHVVYGASLGGLNCGGVFENCAKNYDTSSHIRGIVVAIRYE